MLKAFVWALRNQGNRVNFTGRMPMHMKNVRVPRRCYSGNYVQRVVAAMQEYQSTTGC